MTYKDTHNATSSQGSEYGHSHSDKQDGQTTHQCGQVRARVNLSQLPDDKKVKTTRDTYGQHGSASSKSVNLQSSLENRLRQQLPKGGLMMFMKGWKTKTTPLGRLYLQLQQSVRPIKESDCTLWRSPTASDGKRGPKSVESYKRNRETGKVSINIVDETKHEALWATPNTMGHLPQRSQEAMKRQFSTTRKGRTAPANLREQVDPAMWPTPAASDNRDRGSYNDPCIQKRIKNGKQVELSMIAQGTAKQNGLHVQTGNKGSLNPQFPCWLMGIPTEWDDCAPTETQSTVKLRHPSFVPTKLFESMVD